MGTLENLRSKLNQAANDNRKLEENKTKAVEGERKVEEEIKKLQTELNDARVARQEAEKAVMKGIDTIHKLENDIATEERRNAA